jgi:hypothetical protein
MTKPKTKPAAEPAPKSRSLTVPQRPGVKPDRAVCDLMAEGVASSGSVMVNFLAPEYAELSLTDMVAALKAQGEAANRGDLTAGERMLSAQAAALNAIFGELARRAALNMGTHLDATDRYMRLALKAQGQARATLETLAFIKAPPATFARQMNIAHGPQQVVNHPAPRAPESQNPQTGLLEAQHGERMDFGAQGTAGRANQDLAALEAIHRTQDARGQGKGCP